MSEDDEGWNLYIFVQGYTVGELSVKLAGRYLMISGKHVDIQGNVNNQFQQSFQIPSSVKLETVQSEWNPKGELLVTGSKTGATREVKTIDIKIQKEL